MFIQRRRHIAHLPPPRPVRGSVANGLKMPSAKANLSKIMEVCDLKLLLQIYNSLLKQNYIAQM